MIDIKELFLANTDTIIGTTIGAVLGGIITWFFNNKKIKKSIKVEVQLRVADEISKDITELLKLVSEVHQKMETLYTHRRASYNDKLENKELRQELKEKSRNELANSINKLEAEFDQHFIYLDINEIVLKQFYNSYMDIYDKFGFLLCVIADFDSFHTGKFYDKEDVESLKSDKEKASKVTEELLLSLISFNNIILNKFYGDIFDTKKHSKIYEFHFGRMIPVEKVYQPDKYKKIYKKNKIKREFK